VSPSHADPSRLGHAAIIYSSVLGPPGVETPTALEIDDGSSDTGMGLIPSGTNAVLASPAHTAMRWTPALGLGIRVYPKIRVGFFGF
jgi:hypothetical protein